MPAEIYLCNSDTSIEMTMTSKFFALATLLLFTFSARAQLPTAPAVQSSVGAPLKIGGDVLPPKLVSTVEPEFPHARSHTTKAIVLVGLTVSTDGIPINLHIVKSAGSGFDKNAIVAVSQYRFGPATQEGKPVSVTLIIQVNFEKF